MENREETLWGAVAPNEEMEKVVLTEDKELPKYKVYGQDIFVSEETAIVYYDTSMNLLALANLLLGKFDDKGNYIISKEIKRDLVVMNKEIDEESDNFFKATNLFMKKNFYYYINISMLGDGRAKAALYLYEYVGDFLDKEFIVSHIANFVDVFDENYRDNLRKAFNLVDAGVKNDELKIPALAILMQQMLDEKEKTLSLHDIAAQAYVMRMLQELEKMAYGKKIIDEFKKLLAKYGIGKLPWIKQKAILDRVINKNGGYQKLIKDMPATKKLLEEAIKTSLEIEKAKNEAQVDTEEKKDSAKPAAKPAAKKPAAKKPAAKKAAGKAAGKKPAKKKEEKKDDKKKGGGVSQSERDKFAKLAAAELAKQNKAEEKKKEEPKPDDKKEEPKVEQKKVEQNNSNVNLNDDDFPMGVITAAAEQKRRLQGGQMGGNGKNNEELNMKENLQGAQGTGTNNFNMNEPQTEVEEKAVDDQQMDMA